MKPAGKPRESAFPISKPNGDPFPETIYAEWPNHLHLEIDAGEMLGGEMEKTVAVYKLDHYAKIKMATTVERI